VNRFKQTSDALAAALGAGTTLDGAIRAGRIKIMHDTEACLTAVALRPKRGRARVALVGGDMTRGPSQWRHLFVRVGLGRLACARKQRFVLQTSSADLDLYRDRNSYRAAFDALRLHRETRFPVGRSEIDVAPQAKRAKPRKKQQQTKRRAAA